GFAPLVFLGLRAVGGWSGLVARLADHATATGFAPGAYTRSWAFMGHSSTNGFGVEWFGLAMGLGFVLSFGYWCTDFLVVQRAMAANSMNAARRTPLIAAFPKMFFPVLVVLPGLSAISLPNQASTTVAGASDQHYLWMGRMATVFGIALSVGAAYLATRFNNIMDMLQLVFAFVNAPLFATFLLGMFWKRTTGHGAFVGLLSGTLAAALHHGLTLPAGAAVGVKGGWFGAIHTYPSEMAQNFWTAIFAWVTCFAVTIIISVLTRPRAEEE